MQIMVRIISILNSHATLCSIHNIIITHKIKDAHFLLVR
jgi:hypothetical protein